MVGFMQRQLQRFSLVKECRILMLGTLAMLATLFAGMAHAAALPQFLVVDYHPLSKTAVSAVGGPPLYDYVYRVDVRNAGGAASEVSGLVRSRLPSIAVQDASASFGVVNGHQVKGSVDTITIRAGKFFDRRLDKRVQVNGRWQYQESGHDDDDAQVPGLPPASDSHLEDLIGWFYDIKFQFLFQWSFNVRDNSAPVISELLPQLGQADGKPTVSASFQDVPGGSGVNSTSVKLSVDGVDVTRQAKISAGGISYKPIKPLVDGSHVVLLTVADNSNNTARAAWSFLVDTSKPVVSAQAPKDIRNASPSVVISAGYTDAGGSGIDTAKVSLSVDKVDVSASAVKSATGISYTPLHGLSDGPHRVNLRVVDAVGNVTTDEWFFGVDSRGVTIAQPAPVEGAVLAADAKPVIGASFVSVGTEIVPSKTVLMLDGKNVSSQAVITPSGVSYTPAAPLAEGAHNVKLSVTSKLDYVSETSWNFVTRTAPEIIDVAPRDVVLNAQTTPVITARYQDIGSGINIAGVKLLVDGVDMTAQAQVDATSLALRPAAMGQGLHVLSLTVADNAGNTSTTTWRFTLDGDLPVISKQLPKDTLVNTTRPRISATYQDVGERGSGIDTASVRLFLDGVDVGGQAQIGDGEVSYTPPVALPGGMHTVKLSLADKAGNLASSVWSFTIDAEGPIIKGDVLPADGSVHEASDMPLIRAQYQDTGGGVETGRVTLEIDGQPYTARATISATDITFAPSEPFAEGEHTVRLNVADRAGNSTQRNWAFKTVSAPRVLTYSPNAVTLPGPARPVIAATYSDVGSGVDAALVQLAIDGVDVTSQAKVAIDKIEYAVASPLADGNHVVRLRVVDRSGNATEQQWSFKVLTVVSRPPVISQQAPGDTYLPSGAKPTISASFQSIDAAVDVAGVRLRLNGADVTAQAVIDAAGIRYAVPSALADGVYTVTVTVPDLAGGAATSEWKFGVATGPTIANLTPRDVVLPAGSTAPVAARFVAGTGTIDATTVQVVVDGVDVTAQSAISVAGVNYVPSQPYAEGSHTAYIAVSDRPGFAVEAFWGFSVAPEKAYTVSLLNPASETTVRQRRIEVNAKASSNAGGVVSMTVNGVPMQPVIVGDAISYTAILDLIEGRNDITATATFADGAIRSASSVVYFDGPPAITIFTPSDKQTLGPAGASSPRDLTGNVERPVTVSGTLNKAVVSVTVNQQAAQLNAAGTEFSFPKFFLHEGVNLLTAVATDASGRTATASVTVAVDQTAPLLSIEAPRKDALTSNARIDVRGVVNDAVEGWIDVPYATVTVSNGANKQVRSAKVTDRFYIAEDVPLEVGANVLQVTAEDHVGNRRQQSVTVTRIAVGSDRLTMLAGNRQRGGLQAALPKPLVVVALGRDGNPLAGLPVSFDVLRGTGSIAASLSGQAPSAAPQRNLVVNTDSAGRAQVWLTLGKQSGEAGNMVRAWNAGIGEDIVFTATADKGAPAFIRADGGVTQFGETDASALEPLSAVVTDGEENRVPNIDVVFTVERGDAAFVDGNGNKVATYRTRTDKNGLATARPAYGAEPGLVRVNAQAIDHERQLEIGGASFQLQVLQQRDGPTRFSGKVLSHSGQALPGVRVSLGRTSLSATTDDTGYFAFPAQVPPGKLDLFIDGRTANVQSGQYPALHFEALAVRGQDNVLPHPIFLPPLLLSEAKIVGGSEDVTLKIPGFDGFEMVVKANSVTFPDGSRTGPLVVSPVQLDKLPMVPPGGYNGFMAPAWTIQPSGTRFDPPLQVKVPNSLGLKPGEGREIYQWDHDLATFVPMGRATVSEDGALLVTDPNSGVTKAGWGGPPNPPPDPPKCVATKCSVCQKKSATGKAPCCVADPDKDGYVTRSQGYKIDIGKPVKGPAIEIGRFIGVELSVATKGDISVALDSMCCAKRSDGIGNKSSISGNVGFEFEAAAPLFPILKRIPVAEFIPGAAAFIPQVKIKLGVSAGGGGEYDHCAEKGQVSGKITGSLEIDALSLGAKWDIKYKRTGAYGGMVITEPQEITLLEVGGLGQASGTFTQWNAQGIKGEYGYVVNAFIRLPTISVGSFNVNLGEHTIPITQKFPAEPFNCPAVDGKLTGDCAK